MVPVDDLQHDFAGFRNLDIALDELREEPVERGAGVGAARVEAYHLGLAYLLDCRVRRQLSRNSARGMHDVRPRRGARLAAGGDSRDAAGIHGGCPDAVVPTAWT